MAKQKRLGELLLEAGLINEDQLRGALERQKKWGGRFGSNLVLNGAISEEKLMRFFASRTGIHEMDISGVQILPHIIKKVPLKVAEKYHLVPVAMKDKNTLIVACVDPSDLEALDQVSFITGLKIDPVLTSHSAIQSAIDRFYLGGKPRAQKKAESNSGVSFDTTAPKLVRMENMEKHGGKESLEDPDLIIFGNQSDTPAPSEPKAFSPVASPPPPAEPASGYSYLDNTDDEFNLDFDSLSKPSSTAAPSSPYTLNQKLQALYNVLLKKGLVSEAEILQELKRLKASGKLSSGA